MPDLNSVKTAITHLTDEQLGELEVWILLDEKRRRQSLTDVEHAKEKMIDDLRKDGVIPAVTRPASPAGVADFPAWSDPNGVYYRMYKNGDLVSHKGRVWECRSKSLTGLEPGAAGSFDWLDVTVTYFPDMQPAADDHAWSETKDYHAGDTVIYQGKVYTAVQDVVASPVTPADGIGLWEETGV